MPVSVAVGSALGALVFSLVIWGVLVSGAAVLIERRLGAGTVWIAWASCVVVARSLGTFAFQRSFPGVDSVTTSVYMTGMFVGIPTAAVAMASTLLGRSEPLPSAGRHFILTLWLYFERQTASRSPAASDFIW